MKLNEKGVTEELAGRNWQRWRLVVAMIFGTAVGGPAISSYVLGVFINPVISEFGVTRGSASGAVSLYLLCLAVSIIVFGVLIDYFGPRRPALASIGLLALALAAVSTATSFFAFLILMGTAGIVAGGATTTPYIVSVAGKFAHRRGIALGIGGGCGLGVASAAMPRIANKLITSFSWRDALLGLAAIIAVVGLTSAYLTLESELPGLMNRNTRLFGQIVAPFRSPHFRLLGATVMLVSIGIGGVLVHTIPLLTDRGFQRESAVAAVASIGMATFAGRVGGGYLLDRLNPLMVSSAFFILAGASLICLLVVSDGQQSFVALTVLGFSGGTESDVIAFLGARYFIVAGLGRATGLLFAVYIASSAFGVVALGFLYDIFHTYTIGLTISAALAVTASILILFLDKPDPHRMLDMT